MAVRLTLPARWHGASRRTRSLPAPLMGKGSPLVPGKCPRWPREERARDLVIRVAMSAVELSALARVVLARVVLAQMPGKTSSLSSENFCSCSSE